MDNKRRQILAFAGISALATALPGCATTMLAKNDTDLVVDARHTGKSGERINGKPTFQTIQAALDALPASADAPRRIIVRNGRYYEKLVIDKPYVSLVGESQDQTILTYDAYSGLNKPGGGKWGTFACATLIVRATDFSAANLTIENAYDYLANDAKDAKDLSRTNDPQAVALMTDTGAERSSFRRVSVTGYQDTLFVNVGRSLFEECKVSGNVDFIFGAGQAVFERCEIITRPRSKPGVKPVGYVTAPSTQISKPWGLVFIDCKMLRESDKVPAASSPLGRPWHPTASMGDGRYADPNAIGSSVFINCFMDEHISSEGWAAMSGNGKNGDKVWFQPEDARFFEYHSSGPGAAVNAKRRQLSDVEAQAFTRAKLLGDWRI